MHDDPYLDFVTELQITNHALFYIYFFAIFWISIDTGFPIPAKAESNLDASQVINIGMVEIAAEMLEVGS